MCSPNVYTAFRRTPTPCMRTPRLAPRRRTTPPETPLSMTRVFPTPITNRSRLYICAPTPPPSILPLSPPLEAARHDATALSLPPVSTPLNPPSLLCRPTTHPTTQSPLTLPAHPPSSYPPALLRSLLCRAPLIRGLPVSGLLTTPAPAPTDPGVCARAGACSRPDATSGVKPCSTSRLYTSPPILMLRPLSGLTMRPARTSGLTSPAS